MEDYLLFQSMVVQLFLIIPSQLRFTMATNEITNIVKSTWNTGSFDIKFTLDFADGVSNGLTVVLTTNYILDTILVIVSMTGLPYCN